MAVGTTVIDLYQQVLGVAPSEVVAARRRLRRDVLAALLEARRIIPPQSRPKPRASEIWPLISHHTYGARSLFGTNGRDILPRTLPLLLVHDGLVVGTMMTPVEIEHAHYATLNREPQPV